MARRNIDRQALRQQIQELDIDSELKSQLLQAVSEQKKYGLVWEDHKEEAEEELREKLPVLVEQKDKAIISSPRGTSKRSAAEGKANCQEGASPNHILIEGDNLHALTALTYTHEGKVDVIYIDPPYNTGNKDFVYNDSFVDSEDGYRHSKWLSFMEKRLRIAKKLLSDRGVIFISIDDNEQANLKLLCDEIFGGYNFEGELIIETATDNNPRQVSTEHEYMLCYAKDKSIQEPWSRKSEAASKIRAQYIRLKNKGLSIDCIQEELRAWIKSHKDELPQVAHYDNVDEKGVFHDGDIANTKMGGYCYDIIHPVTGKVCKVPEKGFRFPQSTMERMIQEGDILFGCDETVLIKPKKRIENTTERLRSVIYEDGRAATKLVDTILHRGAFNNPKSVNILYRLIDFTSTKDSIILDFFAGSGTTLHATMQLNAEDGGKRQCILVTNNENNICEEVTYERNKRVINGYTTPKGVEVPGLKDNNLRYYKTQFIGREQTSANKAELMRLSIDMLCIKENTYDEVPFVVDGKKMKSQFVRCFENEEKQIIVVFDPRAVAFVAKALAGIKNSKRVKVFVYSDGQYAYNDEFRGVDVELCALPDAIYQAYRTVLPKRSMVVENMEIDNAAADEAIANAYDYRTEEGGNE